MENRLVAAKHPWLDLAGQHSSNIREVLGEVYDSSKVDGVDPVWWAGALTKQRVLFVAVEERVQRC